jgi:Mn-dependent DtxR family transcriptional regulator
MVHRGEPVTVGDVAHRLGVYEERVSPLVNRLEEAGILAHVQTHSAAKPSHELLLTRTPESLRITEVLLAANTTDFSMEPGVEKMLGKIAEAEASALRDATIADLLEANRGT